MIVRSQVSHEEEHVEVPDSELAEHYRQNPNVILESCPKIYFFKGILTALTIYFLGSTYDNTGFLYLTALHFAFDSTPG